jgi:hypothetical protein
VTEGPRETGWPYRNPADRWADASKFAITVYKEKASTKLSLDLQQDDVSIRFTETEWDALPELFLKGLAVPEIQRWLEELRLEFGERG